MASAAAPRHTLIVGGTRGIARALVDLLAADGHVLSLIGRRPSAGDAGGVRSWAVDITSKPAVLTALDEIVTCHGKVASLVFFQRFRGEGDDWAGELATSLTGTKDIIEALVDRFEERHSSIVVVSSAAGRFVAAEQPLSYHVAKAGLDQLVRYYAVTLGRRGIRVNAVSPGTTVKQESKSFYAQHPELRQLYESITPLGRMGTAEELAAVIAFLGSDRASFVTGQNLAVDGGVSLQWHESLARRLVMPPDLKVTR